MAFPGTYNFSYYRGDTYQFIIRPKNANGTTFALDDYAGNAVFTIANRRGSTGTQVVATATINTIPSSCDVFFPITKNTSMQ